MHKVGIVGSGNVGSALARGLKSAGNEVQMAGRDHAAIRATASWAEVVLLAVPFGAIDDVVAGRAKLWRAKPSSTPPTRSTRK